MTIFCVYTTSNAEECFFCAAFASEIEATRWIRNVKRRGHRAELFIHEQSYYEPIDPEVK